jgi:IMP and pyridine-specific 5'-nucleotidase
MLKRHRRDGMFEFFREMLNHSFVLDAMAESAATTWSHFEQLIDEHIANKKTSRLSEIVPTLGDFFTRLPLRQAWDEYDAKYRVSSRRKVNVSFNEIRHVANLAQIIAFGGVGDRKLLSGGTGGAANHDESSAVGSPRTAPAATTATTATTATSATTTATTQSSFSTSSSEKSPQLHIDGETNRLKLVTFDGDCTLYSDGAAMKSQELANALVALILNGVHVGLVTAAGYGHQSEKYEARVQMLLTTLEKHKDINAAAAARFFVLGGECNFLLHCRYSLDEDTNTHRARLVPDTTWSPEELRGCSDSDMQALLDVAEATLTEAMSDLNLSKAGILRKSRAVGLIQKPNTGPSKLRRESLDECVLRVQQDLRALESKVPYCAFNGGNDVFIDIGNKRVGVRGLQSFFGFQGQHCLHVGDQFLNTGNDFAARGCCPTVWVTSPLETYYVVRRILDDVTTGEGGTRLSDLYK